MNVATVERGTGAPHSPAEPGWLEVLRESLQDRKTLAPPPDAGLAERERKLAQWVQEYRPRNTMERELVARGAHLSWALERAERAEAAALVGRRDEAARQRAEQAEILGRRLLAETSQGSRRCRDQALPPAVLLQRLEATPEGCSWLIARWDEIAAMTASRRPLNERDLARVLRLLGKEPLDTAYDEEANALLAAYDRYEPGAAGRFLVSCADRLPANDPALRDGPTWHAFADAPKEPTEEGSISAGLVCLIVRQTRHLQRLRATANAAVEAGAAALLATASDRVREIEKQQRLHAARSRELRQIVTLLHSLRKAPAVAASPAEEPGKPEAGPQPPAAPPHELPQERQPLAASPPSARPRLVPVSVRQKRPPAPRNGPNGRERSASPPDRTIKPHGPGDRSFPGRGGAQSVPPPVLTVTDFRSASESPVTCQDDRHADCSIRTGGYRMRAQ